jgi:hypothetical protein
VTSITVVIAVLVLLVLAVVLAVGLLVVRRGARSPLSLPSASSGEAAGGFVCPFCKRRYDPGQSGGRCPACGAAAPRR